MNRLEKKTTATLLIAIFMTSMFAFASAAEPVVQLGVKGDAIAEFDTGAWGTRVHLKTTGEMGPLGYFGPGDEGRIVIPVSDFRFVDLETISWSRYTYAGYPAHVDIYLTGGTVLTAEMASNNANNYGIQEIDTLMAQNSWLNTFELTTDDGYGVIGGTTILHDCTQGAGTSDAPFGTLDQWQAADGIENPGVNDVPIGDIIPDVSEAWIVKFEFEADNWVAQSDILVDDVEINGELYDFENAGPLSLEANPETAMVSISLDDYLVSFDPITIGGWPQTEIVAVTHTGSEEIKELVTCDLMDDTDGFYAECLEISPNEQTIAIPGNTRTFDLTLQVPAEGWEPGEYKGTLVFWAEYAGIALQKTSAPEV